MQRNKNLIINQYYRKSEDLTEDKVNNYMEEKLSAHKQLKGGIVFTDTIPRSAAGKILKRELIGK